MNEQEIINKFESLYIPEPNSGCWLWLGTMKKDGYGSFYWRKHPRDRNAHRISWILYNGAIPKGEGHHGICVLHKCDVRCCVNPNHLFLGTQKDNIQDSMKKGRFLVNRPSKLTEPQVLEIKELISQGRTVRWIGKQYGVSHAAIGYIRKGDTWKHLKQATFGGRENDGE